METFAETVSENILLRARVDELEHQNGLLRRQLFGQKSEKLFEVSEEVEQMALSLFDEPVEIPGIKEAETEEITYKRAKPSKNRNPIPDDLFCEEVLIEPSEEEKTCSCCGSEKVEIGREENKVLDIIPQQIFARNYIRPKYACKKCPEEGVVIAPTPDRPIDKSIAESGLLAYVMVSKYVDHLPLYRLERIFSRYNIRIPRSTMSGWVDQIHQMLQPLLVEMKLKILASNYIQADETTIKVQEKNANKKPKKCHLGYLWPYTDGENILFEYKAGRGREGPITFLGNFSGYLQTDGYAGYNQVVKHNGITHLICWAHVRRKFFDARDYDFKKANLVLKAIGKLYAIEKLCRENKFTDEERYHLRQEKAPAILKDIKALLDEYILVTLPRSPLGKAVTYALNHWTKLDTYLLEGKLEIDNNRIENKIRPVALGRKNWLFAGSQAGAERAALFYSLFGTCIINDVNPFEYLKDVLERINQHPQSRIEELLPAQWRELR
ncbi:MAG: IS66 family transposase [Gammaproteobacteria bacterium]|nr:IS66 family transposase [Gammaproteobacteria bacterium]